MQVIKSLNASILTRSFSYQGEDILAIGVAWGFRLSADEPVLEQAIWNALSEAEASGGALDMGMPKANAEFLVFGDFHSPTGQPVKGGRVSVKLAERKKELAVQGDRHWLRGVAGIIGNSEPRPFLAMPINYERAFGGDGYADNPEGIGFKDEISPEGEVRRPLPNIEYPHKLIGSENDRPPPAGYARLDVTWAARTKLAGTYDDQYLRTRLPGLPDDVDWRFFQETPEDQQFPGFLRGDEAFEIHHMNPEHSRLQGKLPGVKGRIFVNQETETGTHFRELPTELDTVVFLPGQDVGVVIHRATVGVIDDEFPEIKHVLLAHENLGDTPRSLEHYEEQFRLRTDREEGFKYAMFTIPLIPEGCQCGFERIQDENPSTTEALAAANMSNYADEQVRKAKELAQEKLDEAVRKQEEMIEKLEKQDLDMDTSLMRQQLAELKKQAVADLDPDKAERTQEELEIRAILEKILPGAQDKPPKPDLTRLNLKAFDELRDYLLAMEEKQRKLAADRLRDNMKGMDEAHGGKLMDKLDALKKIETPDGAPLPVDDIKKGYDLSSVIEAIENPLPADPPPSPLPRPGLLAAIEQTKLRLQEAQTKLDEMQRELCKTMPMEEAKSTLQEQLSKSNLSDTLERLRESEAAASEGEEQIRKGYAMGAHMVTGISPHAGEEATRAEALLTAHSRNRACAYRDFAFVDLSGQDLRGVDLSKCYLEYADLTDTDLSGANLNGAILSHARLNGTNLSHASIKEGNLGGCNIERCDFSGADLSGTTLSQSKILASRFVDARFGEHQGQFLETICRGVDFSGAQMARSNFIELEWTDCRFVGTELGESHFVTCRLDRAVFDQAHLASVNFITLKGESMSFRGARMKNVRFVVDSEMPFARFDGAMLRESNLRDCLLNNASFNEADLSKADLSGAKLDSANLEKAIAVETQFRKADLHRAHLRGINLMEGSLMKARVSGADLRNANLYSVSFLKATVGDTDFSGANLDNTLLKDWRPA
ncbi:MAG: DUF2169 domain-containing protein [Gammaproteobacteria bacterium]